MNVWIVALALYGVLAAVCLRIYKSARSPYNPRRNVQNAWRLSIGGAILGIIAINAIALGITNDFDRPGISRGDVARTLGYEDGTLNNLSMIEIAEQITQLISSLTSNEPADSEIEFMIFDLNGLTGHIDHIVASRSACKVFYTLKATDTRFTRIRLYCAPDSLQPTENVEWIYAEKGRSTKEITEVVDARPFRDDILAVMRAHHTQRSDCEAAIKSRGDTLGLDSFLVKT